jgi:Flp pilus assembly protein TadD
VKLRQPEEAIDDLNEAIRISPNDREAYQLRAAVWKKLRKSELANKDLAEAKRLETIRK